MKKPSHLLLIVLGLILAIFLLARVPQQRIISRGVDSYNTHRTLFDDHTFSQDIITQGTITDVGAILVDLTRSQELVDVHVSIEDPNTQQTLAQAVIPATAIADDTFASVKLPQPVGQQMQPLRLHFRAPEATNQNPIGVRYDPDHNQANFQRLENNEVQPGVFAVQISEKVPLWRFLTTNITQSPQHSQYAAISLLIAATLAALATRLGFHQFTPRQQTIIEYSAIVILIILALATRAHIISQLKGVSGGDPYNYLFITDSLTEFQNPFAGVKRLPGYPLLLAPTYLLPQVDDQLAMRTVSALSAGGALFMLFLLARSLKLPWAVQLLAPALIAWQKDFLWVSTRPEPYTLYTFLLLTALVLWLNQTKRWQQLTFGLVLGLAAMTRQEGFVLAAILGLASLARAFLPITRQSFTKQYLQPTFKKLAWAYLPALLLVSPFFLHNATTFGNPIYTPYFKGERLQIVDSVTAFQDALGATWGVIGAMYKTSWVQLERVGFSDDRFGLGATGVLLWFGFWHYTNLPRRRSVYLVITTIALGLTLTQLWISITATPSSTLSTNLLPVTAGIIFIAAIPFLVTTKAGGLLIAIVLASQMLIATWFHPFPKHYQQSYPLIALFVTTALVSPLFHRKYTDLSPPVKFTLILPIILAVPLITFQLFTSLNAAIDRYNTNTALDSVVYRATQLVRTMPGPHGFDQAYLPARLYFTDQARYYTPEDTTPEREQDWLLTNNVNTLVVVNSSRAFRQPPDNWQPVKTFKSAGNDGVIFESTVYQRQ